MLRNGWIRLWIVASGFLIAGTACVSAYYVWGQEACYKFESVSPSESLSDPDQNLFDHIKSETVSKQFCGSSLVSPLLTIEDMAQRGAITQVGLEWLKPSGWSMASSSELEVLDGKEIKASTIINHMSQYAQRARLPFMGWAISIAIAISFAVLLVGLSIAWVVIPPKNHRTQK